MTWFESVQLRRAQGPWSREVHVSWGEDLGVRIRLHAQPGLPAPVVGLIILTEDRRFISSFGTHFSGITPLLNQQGDAELFLTLPALPLLKGSYQIDAFLLDESGVHIYESAHACAQLHVTQPGLELGLVTLQHHWDHHDHEFL